MSKIGFNYEDKDYVLEFDRLTVRTMESQGFRIDEVVSKPATRVPQLIYGAFMKNHKNMKRAKADEIYEKFSGKADLVSALMRMYQDTVNALLDDDPDAEGNVPWAEMK